MHAIAETEAGTRMIMLCGAIDHDEAAHVGAALVDADSPVATRVIVEIGATVTMGGTALRMFLTACAAAAGCGTVVDVRCETAHLRHLFASGQGVLLAT